MEKVQNVSCVLCNSGERENVFSVCEASGEGRKRSYVLFISGEEVHRFFFVQFHRAHKTFCQVQFVLRVFSLFIFSSF